MTLPSPFSVKLQRFVGEIQDIMDSGDERARIVDEVIPLLREFMEDESSLNDEYRVNLAEGRYRYEFFKNDNESLSITAPAFLPGHPTPIHDHLTWGVIGVFAGKQITTRYRRCDDGTHSGLADLKVVSEEILTRGAIYPLLPPDDIHSIEAIGDEPGISIHVLGNDLSRQKRHIFHPDIGTVEDWDGGSMMR